MIGLLSAFLLALALAGTAAAQANLPAPALAAERDGRWEDALAVYRTVLELQPSRLDLWLRVADIEARLGRPLDAAKALRCAVDLAPADASLHHRLSQAHALGGEPEQALQAIDSALVLRPDDPEYLRSAGILATWSGDYATAQRYYRRLYAVDPDPETLLLLGRVSAWAGDTDAATRTLRSYLRARPDSPEGWLELARAESWRGNAPGAFAALGQYRARFGESAAFEGMRARVLVDAGRPWRAAPILERLMAREIVEADLLVTNALSQVGRGKLRAARASLASLQRLAPGPPETDSVRDMLRTTFGSRVEPGLSVYSDSDQLEVVQATSAGSLMFATSTRISAGFDHSVFRAAEGSGLNLSGGGAATRDLVWGGLAQTIGRATFDTKIGLARQLGDERIEYWVGARLRALDTLSIQIDHRQGFFLVSPRTLELGLRQQDNRLQLVANPTLKWTVVVEAADLRISDGNRRWTASVAPRYALVRTARLNLDAGVSAHTMRNSRDVSNGYYAPRAYESYTATLYPYLKVTDNVGVATWVAAGGQRERSRPFRGGLSAGVEATVGIYQAWMLRGMVSAMQHERLASGAYRGLNGSLTLVRRF